MKSYKKAAEYLQLSLVKLEEENKRGNLEFTPTRDMHFYEEKKILTIHLA